MMRTRWTRYRSSHPVISSAAQVETLPPCPRRSHAASRPYHPRVTSGQRRLPKTCPLVRESWLGSRSRRVRERRVPSTNPSQAPSQPHPAPRVQAPGRVHGNDAWTEATAASSGEEDPSREGRQGGDRGGEEDE